MLSEQPSRSISEQGSRCDERDQVTDRGQSLDPIEKQDAALKTDIANSLWKDDVIRALDYSEIDLRVKNGVVTLDGHITNSGSQNRVANALREISGIKEIKNNLISDDNLTLAVAAALGELEHTYGCKFFTGASHGVISINGTVKNKNVRLLAEKCASDVPHIRGVINNIQAPGKKPEVQNLPFLQPIIGEYIYFLDWVSGVVKQVIMNPNNRRVVAMVVLGKFTSQLDEHTSIGDVTPLPQMRLAVIPMKMVRYLTRTSGFLYIKSDQKSSYMDFAPVHFIAPPSGWQPPYPYCSDEVLFPVEYRNNDLQIEYEPDQYSFTALTKHTLLGEQLLANDSPGG